MAIQAQIYSGFSMGVTQDLLMENACGSLNSLCFNVPQPEQQFMPKIPFFSRNYNMDSHQSIPFFSPNINISAHIENQRMEIDQFILSQNERLRMALQEQKKQQITLFLKKYESKIQFLINQKEEEISKATKRTIELQNFLHRMEIESETWQRVAKENESMIVSLNNTIERLREDAAAVGDAESCCGEEEKFEDKCMKVCRRCNSRSSCVIILPCRHLCLCRDCDEFINYCPVCNMVKKASIEALI